MCQKQGMKDSPEPAEPRPFPPVDIPPGATGVVVVDVGQVVANWQALARLVAPAACAAVVKADAYGLGAQEIIPALVRAGCTTFFVATPDEAMEARGLAPEAELFVLDGVVSGAEARLEAARAIPVLASLDEVHVWAKDAEKMRRPRPAALNLDTGLNRLGLSGAEVEALARDKRLLAALHVRLVMSHLASADDPSDGKNAAQRAAFETLRTLLPKARASLAASDGLMLGRAFRYDMVRPGYALYGGQAFRGVAAPVSPAVRVAARILQVRDVARGETVGYSGTWTALRPSRIAIVAAGYADGFARAGSAPDGQSGGEVRVGGTLAPVVGRVSMDLITVDVTDVPAGATRGSAVDLIGPGLTIEAVGQRAGTIGYEVLTRLGRRFQRIYLGG